MCITPLTVRLESSKSSLLSPFWKLKGKTITASYLYWTLESVRKEKGNCLREKGQKALLTMVIAESASEFFDGFSSSPATKNYGYESNHWGQQQAASLLPTPPWRCLKQLRKACFQTFNGLLHTFRFSSGTNCFHRIFWWVSIFLAATLFKDGFFNSSLWLLVAWTFKVPWVSN